MTFLSSTRGVLLPMRKIKYSAPTKPYGTFEARPDIVGTRQLDERERGIKYDKSFESLWGFGSRRFHAADNQKEKHTLNLSRQAHTRAIQMDCRRCRLRVTTAAAAAAAREKWKPCVFLLVTMRTFLLPSPNELIASSSLDPTGFRIAKTSLREQDPEGVLPPPAALMTRIWIKLWLPSINRPYASNQQSINDDRRAKEKPKEKSYRPIQRPCRWRRSPVCWWWASD